MTEEVTLKVVSSPFVVVVAMVRPPVLVDRERGGLRGGAIGDGDRAVGRDAGEVEDGVEARAVGVERGGEEIEVGGTSWPSSQVSSTSLTTATTTRTSVAVGAAGAVSGSAKAASAVVSCASYQRRMTRSVNGWTFDDVGRRCRR